MSMMKTTQSRFFKSCETFLSKVNRSNISKYKQIVSLLIKYSHKKSENGQIELLHKLVHIIKDNNNLLSDLNKLLHSNLQIPIKEDDSSQPQEQIENNGNQYQDKIQACFKLIHEKNPEKLAMIKDYLIKESKNTQDTDPAVLVQSFLSHCQIVLQENSETYQQIKLILSDFVQKIKQNSQGQQTYYIQKPKKSNKTVERKESEIHYQKYSQSLRNNLNYPLMTNVNKSEYSFFDSLKLYLKKEEYQELIKCINLYNYCIISSHELFDLTKHLFQQYENSFNIFINIIMTRESSKKKSSTYFKPLQEVDFSSCNREGHSYTQLPQNFPKQTNKGANSISIQNINKDWVSVPSGSEHYTFTNMRKNQYEEALFKCEDEKFEFDITINTIRKCIQYLKDLKNPQLSEQNQQDLINRILKFKIVQSIFQNQLQEYIEQLKSNPVVCNQLLDILIDKIQNKLNDVVQIKNNQAKKVWSEIAEKNFHRSLDHRSFYFKKQEKKQIALNRFIAEADYRFNKLKRIKQDSKENEGFKKEIYQFEQSLNTLEENEDVETMVSEKQGQMVDCVEQIRSDIYKPIFRFNFNNKQIKQDTFNILLFYISNFHVAQNEKEKIKSLIQLVFIDILGFDCQAIEYDDQQMNEQILLQKVQYIEQKIFDKSYSFFQNENIQVTEKGSGQNQETIRQRKQEKKDSDDDIFVLISDYCQDSQNESMNEEKPKIKQVQFYEENVKKSNRQILYGTKNIYILMRFILTLYQRLSQAVRISYMIQNNCKSNQLKEKEKEKLGNERYQTFKIVLINLIKQKIDITKYEDFLRSIFGSSAYLFFTLDKILSMTTKSFQQLANDEISNSGFQLLHDLVFRNSRLSEETQEQIIFQKLDELMLKSVNQMGEKHIFKIEYEFGTDDMWIYMFDAPSKYIEKDNVRNLLDYVHHYMIYPFDSNTTQFSNQVVFLNRNKQKVKQFQERNKFRKIQSNNIQMKLNRNSIKLVNLNRNQEDYLLIQYESDCMNNQQLLICKLKQMARLQKMLD